MSDSNGTINDFDLDAIGFSVRTTNCLQNVGVSSLLDLLTWSEQDLLKTKNFGRKSLKEVKHELEGRGLVLGSMARMPNKCATCNGEIVQSPAFCLTCRNSHARDARHHVTVAKVAQHEVRTSRDRCSDLEQKLLVERRENQRLEQLVARLERAVAELFIEKLHREEQ